MCNAVVFRALTYVAIFIRARNQVGKRQLMDFKPEDLPLF